MIKFIILLCLCLSGCADNPFRQEVEAQLREDNIRQAVTTLGDRPAINISANKDRVKDAIQTVLTQKGIPIESVTDYQILSGWIPSRTGIPLVKEQMRFFIESAADKVTISASCVQQISVLYGTALYNEMTKSEPHRDELTLILIVIKKEAETARVQ